jgi:hypothetical protein
MASRNARGDQLFDDSDSEDERDIKSYQDKVVPDVITKYGNTSSNERDLGSGGFTNARYKQDRKVIIGQAMLTSLYVR